MRPISEIVPKLHTRARRLAWRLTHDCRPNAVPVFVVGVQRSGTSILMTCLELSAELLCLSEKRRSVAFTDFRLHDDDVIRGLIEDCRYRAIAFKPLTDSHRVASLLDLTPNAKAIWVYRRAADRANSAVRKFGSHNLELLAAFKRGEELDRWQAQGLSDASVELIRRFNYESMTPESAAALYWHVRNSLFFEQGLDARADVKLVAYERLVEDPEATLSSICEFIGIDCTRRMWKDLHQRSVGKRPSRVSDDIEGLCERTYQRLDAARAGQEAR